MQEKKQKKVFIQYWGKAALAELGAIIGMCIVLYLWFWFIAGENAAHSMIEGVHVLITIFTASMIAGFSFMNQRSGTVALAFGATRKSILCGMHFINAILISGMAVVLVMFTQIRPSNFVENTATIYYTYIGIVGIAGALGLVGTTLAAKVRKMGFVIYIVIMMLTGFCAGIAGAMGMNGATILQYIEPNVQLLCVAGIGLYILGSVWNYYGNIRKMEVTF